MTLESDHHLVVVDVQMKVTTNKHEAKNKSPKPVDLQKTQRSDSEKSVPKQISRGSRGGWHMEKTSRATIGGGGMSVMGKHKEMIESDWAGTEVAIAKIGDSLLGYRENSGGEAWFDEDCQKLLEERE